MRKKILSLALACLMIMTAFATVVSAETAPFTVTGNDVGETASDCSTWAAALAKVYEYGGGTIDFNSDYTMVSTDTNAGTADIEITINGNGKILTDAGAADVFSFKNGGIITVNNLNILSSSKRIEVANGAKLTMNDCTWETRGLGENDTGGYIRTSAGSSFDTTVTLNRCTVWATGGTVLFGTNSVGGRGIIVNVNDSSINNPFHEKYGETSSTITNSALYSSFSIYGFAFGMKNINIHNSVICSNKRVLRSLANANISITGNSKVINTHSTAEFFNVTGTGTTNVTIGKDACIINNGTKWYGISGSATERLNFNVTDLDFLKTSNNKGVTTTDVDLNYAIPTLEDGASVRTTQDTEGLRFTANIAKDAVTAENTPLAEYGIIAAAATNELTSDNFTMEALGEGKYVKVASTDDGFKKDDSGDAIVYNAVLTGMADTSKNYSARAYATYKYDTNINITVYSAYDANVNSRNVKQVATLAYNDLLTQAEIDAKVESGDLTAAEAAQYTCTVGDKLSRYGTEQRKVLATIAGISTEA